jgi:hypothetical protein
VPEPLLLALRGAVERADLDQILSLIDTIPGALPAVAGELRRLAERFDYERLMALLGPPSA